MTLRNSDTSKDFSGVYFKMEIIIYVLFDHLGEVCKYFSKV